MIYKCQVIHLDMLLSQSRARHDLGWPARMHEECFHRLDYKVGCDPHSSSDLPPYDRTKYTDSWPCLSTRPDQHQRTLPPTRPCS